MKSVLMAFATAFLPCAAFAQPTIVVECGVRIASKVHTALIRLNSRGEVVPYSKSKLLGAPLKSIFGFMGDNPNESAMEYVNTFRAPNGYSVVQGGTTADEITVGVSPDLSKGFYSYRDIGSGNGNMRYYLACRRAY